MRRFQRFFAFFVPFVTLILCVSVLSESAQAQDKVEAQELLATGGAVRAMAANGDRLFVGKGSRLVIYDVTGDDPVLDDEPIELTQTPVQDVIFSLIHSGNHLYLGLKHGDIVIVDVSDEVQPTIVGRLTVRVNDEENKEVEGLAISGNHLYCNLGKDGLQVVDVSNPANPQLGVNISASQEWINGVIVENNRLYALERLIDSPPSKMAVRTYNLTNPAAPSLLGSVNVDENVGGLHLSIDGDYAYVYGEWYDAGVIVVDVSNPATPVKKGTFSDGEHTPIISVRGDGDRFYAQSSAGFRGEATKRLITVSLSNPDNPQKLGETELTGFQTNYTGTLPMVGDRIFCSFGTGDTPMQIVDVSDPESPVAGLEFDEPTTFFGQTVIGTTLYRSSQEKLFVYDITDLSTPELLRTYEGASFENILNIEGEGDQFFLTQRNGEDVSVLIVDIADPDNPVQRGSYVPVDQNHRVDAKGDYLYVITADGEPWNNDPKPWGLDIVDISNPNSPNRVARIEGTIRDIIAPAEGNHIYILADDLAGNLSAHKGVVALNVANPASPTVASSRQTAGTRGRMTLSGSTLLTVTNTGSVFAPGHFWSLESFDLSNPSAINSLERYDGPIGEGELASDVVVTDDGIVTVGIMGVGLRFFEYDDLVGRNDKKGAQTLDGPTLAGSYASSGISSFGNYSANGNNYIIGKEYTWASIFSYPDNRNNYHRGDGGNNYICYRRVDPDFVLLLTSVWPAKAAKAGAKASPPGLNRYAKGSTAQLNTTGVRGWTFKQWVGAASGNSRNTTVLMDAHKAAAAVYRTGLLSSQPTLSVSLGSPPGEMHCPPDPKENQWLRIATVTLSADEEADWKAGSLTLTGIGGGAQKYVKEVVLTVRGKEKSFFPSKTSNDPIAEMTFNLNEVIQAGTSLKMNLLYSFDFPSKVSDGRYMPCPIGSVPSYGVQMTSAQVAVIPLDPQIMEYVILPPSDVVMKGEEQRVACVQNISTKEGFDEIQASVNNAQKNDVIQICPGRYVENVKVYNIDGITLRSAKGVAVTELLAKAGKSALSIESSDSVTINELTLLKEDDDKAEDGDVVWLYETSKVNITNNVIRHAIMPEETMGARDSYYNCIDVNESDDGIIKNNTLRGGVSIIHIKDFSSRNHILQNRIHDGHWGILLIGAGCNNNLIEFNTISKNRTGIWYWSHTSEGNRIYNNLIANNRYQDGIQTDVGIEVWGGIDEERTKDPEIKRNVIRANEIGVAIEDVDLRIIQNQFVGNWTAIKGQNASAYFYGNGLYDHGTTVDFDRAKEEKGHSSLAVDENRGSITLNNSRMIAKGNDIRGDSTNGIYTANGSVLLLRKNVIEGNGEYGAVNDDPEGSVDARFNWWGDASGPSGEGLGSGDAVSTYVDYENWLPEQVSLVVSAGYDTLWVSAGRSDSISIYYQNWQKRDDGLNVASEDDLGWVSGTGTTNVTIADSLGGEITLSYTVPENISNNRVNILRFNAISTTDAGWNDADSVVMVAYRPQLVRLALEPDTVKVLPGDSILFGAVGLDQHDQFFETEGLVWSAEGGTIDEGGGYYAGDVHGTYEIRVRHTESGLEETAVVIITDDLSSVAVEEPVAGERARGIESRVVPNPFSGETGVHFSVDRRSSVTLEIYDGLGRRVETLIDATLPADNYEARWTPTDLPNGIYLYRLRIGEEQRSGQLILTR